MNPEEFKKYAIMDRGISSVTLENYMSVTGNGQDHLSRCPHQ